MRLRHLAAAVLTAGTMLLAPSVAAAAPTACPSAFTVLHDDRIGSLAVPASEYQLTTLDASRLSCAAATDAFRRFLWDFDGRLPAPWTLNAVTRTFTGPAGGAFTIAAMTGTPSGIPATDTRCPGVFRVPYDEQIGTFQIPAGDYTLTLVSIGPLSCADATTLLPVFLQDFDGKLPSPWLLDPQSGTFLQGTVLIGFRIELAITPLPGPVVPAAGRRCAGTFQVRHNDRIGALRFPAGRYQVTLVGSGGPSCATSNRSFARFLAYPGGRLPRPWRLSPSTATFTTASGAGFRVKALQ